MVSVDNAVIARANIQGHHFEVLVDCMNALAVKEGRHVAMKDVLAAEKIFTDGRKGTVASEHLLKQLFNTIDPETIAIEIIKKAEIQLTAEYRQKLREQKRKQIINIIHRNGVDPKTHLPHPAIRIENAFEEAKFHVDEFMPVERQVQEALKKLKPILPIRFEVKEIQIKIGPVYAAKAYATVKSFGAILSEAWGNDGYFVATVEMPGGMEQEFYDKLNAICHGEIESKVVKIK